MAADAHPTPAPGGRRLRGVDDERLVALVRDGRDDAFVELCRRHEPRLRRLATRILKDPHLAEDIVQEGLWRAHRALLRDRREVRLKPWLAQIVRNCALDELGRRPQVLVELHDEHAARDADPHDTLGRRADARQLLADLTTLPPAQRHALVRRELDGVPHEQIAAELDITAGASRNLVHRARTNLTRLSHAREAACVSVQRDLLAAHDERRRASVATYRHLAGCPSCRAYRRRLHVCRQVMAATLLPPGLLVGAALAVKAGVLGVLPGAGAGAGVSAKPAALAAATALVAGGAATLGAVHVAMPGDRSPLAVQSAAIPGHRVERGQPLPAATAVVSHRLEAGATVPRQIRLRCPAGMVAAGLIPNPDTRLSRAYDPSSHPGDRVVTINLRAAKPLRTAATIATVCRTHVGP
ncbi:MAG TPA: sigma-70 family RNA polymerase sigma factor [Baekduia sp.]|uniref:RNA polymerase sigma factor n=1 Tax=Baekduia sp. TaxID=2600305 RepID=UPI002D78E5E3|nr:sigma-70 family RNA polymerase sigma factor [Baekduia sp.]HET6505802.1 sigma-70 family RNA polymerase sigma factor [Baekduia sp.]